MADTTYKIAVDTRDATRSIDGLKTALAGLAAAFSIRELVQFSDGITGLRNKLLTLTPDIETVNRQFNALAAIAITARTPLEATADLFFRIQRSAKALGISQQEAAQITESVAKALTASGQSASEAAGPLLQLGQALQSGVFQGDELRSILEGLPQVSKALAEELGVTVGQLKKLGSEGQISADVFVRAMRRAKDSIDESFARTQPTISQAITLLKSVASIGFDQFEKNTQLGRTFAAAIEYIAFTLYKFTQRIDEFSEGIIKFLKITAVILSLTLLGRIITFVANTFISLFGIIKSFGGLIVSTIGYIKKFGDEVLKLSKPLQEIVNKVVAIVSALAGATLLAPIIDGFKKAYDSITGFVDGLFSASDASSQAGKELAEFRKQMAENAKALDDQAGSSENAIALQKELAKAFARARLEMEAQVGGLERGLSQTRERLALENEFLILNKERRTVSEDDVAIAKMLTDIDIERRNAIATLNDQLKKMNLEYSQMTVKDSQAGKELAGRIGILKEQIRLTGEQYDKHSQGMVTLTRSNQNLKILDEARKRDNEAIIKLIEDQTRRAESLGGILENVNRQVAEELLKRPDAMVGFTSLQKRFVEIEQSAKKAAQAAGRSFAQAFEDTGDGLTADQAEAFARGLTEIEQAYTRLADVQKGFAEDQYNIQRSFEFGWKDAIARFVEDANDGAKQARTYFDTFISGFENAIVRFVQTGKLSFKDLVSSLIADFARIQARRMLFNFLGASGLGSLFGAKAMAGSAVLGLPGFAKGGYLPSGQMGIVGEQGPELITGPANITPMDKMAQQPLQITYNIQAVDASSFRALVARDPQFIYNVTEQGRRSQPSRRLA